jgi:hypothetical protein
MPVPTWVEIYTVVVILGLIVGLLLRQIVTTILVLAAVLVGVWLIGLVAASALAGLPTLTGRILGGLPIGPQVLFTVGGLVFLVGVLGGLLLTSRLSILDRSRPA